MSKEARIEQITKEGAPTVYQIWDSLGYTVVLNAEEALMVLDFLHRNLGELTREVNGREEMLRQLQHEQNERSITRSHFDSDAAWEDWNVDDPQP